MGELISFHGDQKIKNKFIKRLEVHYEADEIIHGVYWENGKGCAVGCTLHDYNHAAYETELGIPEWLARLEDRIFEGLTNGKAKKFPIQFLKAIPLGKNLEKVKYQFALFLLEENRKHVEGLKISEELRKEVLDAICKCAVVNKEALETGRWNESAAWSAAWSAESAARSAVSAAESAARSASRSAAESAAWSAAESAAWSAVWSAAWSAAWSAESAAWSAVSAAESAASAASAAWSAVSAAESAAYERYADKLLELLSAA
jgi:hypothetical protein